MLKEFLKEYSNFPVLLVLIFLYGILLYFAEFTIPLFYLSLSIPLIFLARKYFPERGAVIISAMIFSALLGYYSAYYRISSIDYKPISKNIKLSIQGKVTALNKKEHGIQLLLADIKSSRKIPGNIRINVRTNYDGVRVGDVIATDVSLMPPPKAVIPGGYDFARRAFFQNISAVGYALSDIQIKQSRESGGYIDSIRGKIRESLITNLDKDMSSFAIAIILGETSSINNKIMDNMRAAGLSHILCVSGMHVSLVAMLFFIWARFLFACSDYMSLGHNTRLLSFLISFIGSFGYLLLSGVNIAASRAFIMGAVVIYARITGRISSGMRAIALAAFILLLLNPEYCLYPSFTLSFIAVIALIAAYEFLVRKGELFESYKGISRYLILYFFSMIYSTAIASIATAPFIIYYFYNYSNYSILANLFAVPLTSYIIMPFAIISVLAMIFGLEYYPLQAMEYGIYGVVKVANYVSALPYAIIHTGHISHIVIILYLTGFLILCCLISRIRLVGVCFIALSLGAVLLSQKPKIIYGERGVIGVNENGKLVIYSTQGWKISKFYRKYWANWFGQEDAEVRYIVD